MKNISLISIILFLFSCNTYLYKFSILEPEASQTSRPQENPNNPIFSYSDSLINITISISGHQGAHGATIAYLYDGISFSLTNKTDSVAILDWNKISFMDASGNSGGSVMHENIKYTDCASMKSPATIPPHGKISDIITPCSGLHLDSGNNGPYWWTDILPYADEVQNVEFGFYMPISFGSLPKSYTFKFKGESLTADK
jgi:hypothetical protein